MTDLMTYPHDFRVQQDSHTVGNHPQHFSHLLHHVCKSSQIHFEFRPLCEFLYGIASRKNLTANVLCPHISIETPSIADEAKGLPAQNDSVIMLNRFQKC